MIPSKPAGVQDGEDDGDNDVISERIVGMGILRLQNNSALNDKTELYGLGYHYWSV